MKNYSDPSLTPWFPKDKSPVWAGVYQRLYDEGTVDESVVYCFWTGTRWMSFGFTPSDAETHTSPSIYNDKPWRGLVAPQVAS